MFQRVSKNQIQPMTIHSFGCSNTLAPNPEPSMYILRWRWSKSIHQHTTKPNKNCCSPGRTTFVNVRTSQTYDAHSKSKMFESVQTRFESDNVHGATAMFFDHVKTRSIPTDLRRRSKYAFEHGGAMSNIITHATKHSNT